MTVTTEQYAEELVRLVRADFTSAELRHELSSWSDLHDRCDANEYLIWADEKFGLNEDDFISRIPFTNEAITIAEKALFPKAAV